MRLVIGSCRIVTAGPVWSTLLAIMGFGAVTTPWRTIYVHPSAVCDRRLIRHERAHIRQMDRDGWLRFWVRYYWWLIRYGYWDHPYEVEARKAERWS